MFYVQGKVLFSVFSLRSNTEISAPASSRHQTNCSDLCYRWEHRL